MVVGVTAAAILVDPVKLDEQPAVVTYGREEAARVDAAPEAEAPEVEAPAVEEAPSAEALAGADPLEEPARTPTEEAPETETGDEVAMVVPEQEPVPEVDPTPQDESVTPEPEAVNQDPEPEAVNQDPEPEAIVEDPAPDVVAEEPEVVVEDPAPEAAQLEDPDTADAPAPESAPVEAVETEPAPAPTPKEDIITGRLPSIGAEAPVEAAPQLPAIERNAIDFVADPALPKMTILLMDDGEARGDVGDLSVLPFALSVAVDASLPDAAEAIAYYRSVGAEVVVIVPLPEGATATDVDVTFQAYSPFLEEAVAVMMAEEAGFQSLGPAAAQLAVNLEEAGLGLVTFPEGLNTGHKTAVKEGVPAGLVFRDLDGEGQAPQVIRRFLDNVAFKARNEEATIALARLRPDSLQAILEWSLGNRAQSVNLAPVSAILPR